MFATYASVHTRYKAAMQFLMQRVSMGSTMQAKQLSFLDENQNSLSHFSMDVNIEEKAGGDVHTASIHPTVLEKLLGKRATECLHNNTVCNVLGMVEICDRSQEYLHCYSL